MEASLRPMSTSQVLDRTFFLYRNNFVLFAGIALVTPTLNLIAQLVQLAIFGVPVTPEPSGVASGTDLHALQAIFDRAAVAGLIGVIIYTIGYAITTGATVRAVSMLHLGRTTTIKESYERVKPIWGRLVLLVMRIFFVAIAPLLACYAVFIALLLMVFAVGRGGSGNVGVALGAGLGMIVLSVGMVTALVWGVISYCRYSLAVPACAIEGLPVKYSLIRSKFLTKGNLGRVFAVYLLTAIISIAVKSLLQVPAYAFSGFSLRGGFHIGPGLLAWIYASDFIGSLFAGPIAAIAMALVYYDERVRKEAFDLQLMIEAMRAGEATQIASVQSVQ